MMHSIRRLKIWKKITVLEIPQKLFTVRSKLKKHLYILLVVFILSLSLSDNNTRLGSPLNRVKKIRSRQ